MLLQQMRGLAKYVWYLVAVAFIGGFLMVQTSGLLGRTVITPTTAVAVVNGHDLLYRDYVDRVSSETQGQQQRSRAQLTQDDTRRIGNDVFEQMVMEVLLQEEYKRRGIVVTDQEIQDYARTSPPPQFMQVPDLQTNGQFDIEKYRRYMGSAAARQTNLLQYVESFYRDQIPREKLFDQIASGVYVTDWDLWRMWRDSHDSAAVSYVAFRPGTDTSKASIPDGELQKFLDTHEAEFRRPGRAVVSVLWLPKAITAQDTADARKQIMALRAEIAAGAKFEDVAKRASTDSTTAVDGGKLPKSGKGSFVMEFEKASYALKVGEISQPVLSPFGFHLIKLDARQGDSLSLRHILIPIAQSDSETARVDRRADSLATLATSADNPADNAKRFDEAAAKLGVTPLHLDVEEDRPASFMGQPIPSVSAWTFNGARVGDVSDLFDSPDGYAVVRVDSLQPGTGDHPPLKMVRDQVRARVAMQREMDTMAKTAAELAAAAAGGSLESAATGKHMLVEKAPAFTRAGLAGGLGYLNAAVGAAFGLPIGAVSQPIRTEDGVFVIRVDRRVPADSAVWAAQKAQQRQQRLQGLRQQKVQQFLEDLRSAAKVDDRRDRINAAVRRTGSS